MFSLFFIRKLQILFLLISSTSTVLSQTHWETAIYAEDNWSYFVGSTPPPENWNQLNFDTSDWGTGQGGFGYADGDDNTVIENTLSVFFRKTFNITSLEEIASLAIHADYDDGFVAHINGIEILRSSNMGEPGSRLHMNKLLTQTTRRYFTKGERQKYLFYTRVLLKTFYLQERTF